MPTKGRKRNRSNQIAVPAPQSQSESVSIRQISNGFIIERSGVKRGKYVTHQEYSAGRPVVSAAAPPESKSPAPARAQARPRNVAPREVGYLTQKD